MHKHSVSASSWLQGPRALVPCMFVLRTCSLCVVITVLSGCIVSICMAREAKMSALFLSSRRNSCQLCGTQTFPVTIHLTPLPHWVLVCAFRLWSLCLYISTYVYNINWVDPLQLGFHIWKYFLQGVITEGFTTCWACHVHDHCPIQNYTITFWNLSLGISFTL